MLNILSLLLAVSQRCTSYLNPPFKKRVKAAGKKILYKVFNVVATTSNLRIIATQVAFRLGIAKILKQYIRSMYPAPHELSEHRSTHQPKRDLSTLNPQARQIYCDLKQAIEKKQKDEA